MNMWCGWGKGGYCGIVSSIGDSVSDKETKSIGMLEIIELKMSESCEPFTGIGCTEETDNSESDSSSDTGFVGVDSIESELSETCELSARIIDIK